MTDKELLVAAAKAAGIVGEVEEFYLRPGDKTPILAIGCENGVWSPLTDDGDALRLAVKLRINVIFGEWVGADESAATRRAIVRAAAAMAS